MHSKCRNQLACDKCKARFSTITSLTKHKRSCDPSQTTRLGRPLSPRTRHRHHHINSSLSSGLRTTTGMAQSQPSPFLFPQPSTAAFYPPNFVDPYSATLFRNSAGLFPFFFPPKPLQSSQSDETSQTKKPESTRIEDEPTAMQTKPILQV